MKDALEELSFIVADAIEGVVGVVWWVLRASLVVLAISLGIIVVIALVGWLLQNLAGVL